ncbi:MULTISPECIES: hypothetical protein [Pseudomonas syringae group]|jgi:hypothetical protein|uniref:Uncharacterized protein n=1 Tax=Pseudomonas syringae group genomosp. 3 TaxID=251701 RepID=A0A2K4WFK0_9PSED|nr:MULTISPECIES: hypothetical protein [Pseudomonas syringae group]MBI6740389.1 hypothetical protein [Pseudomonas syringae]MBI6745954.1 hypothetical protein [Pseudomonas syringae]MBI6760369.1 hypothetical protein [Pseudomonas syringae]MBI6806758.1 hypothetical protein [Pseudomonas syringae]MBI6827353.1 hypothetical protein [Pseudomonas syringae]
MLEKSLIGPVEVKRDEDGYWYHPGVPDFDESVAAYKEWVSAQRIEITGWHMDSDLESHPYFDGEAANCLGWEPETPAGPDWFLLGIFDTDDGPYVQWARRANLTSKS